MRPPTHLLIGREGIVTSAARMAKLLDIEDKDALEYIRGNLSCALTHLPGLLESGRALERAPFHDIGSDLSGIIGYAHKAGIATEQEYVRLFSPVLDAFIRISEVYALPPASLFHGPGNGPMQVTPETLLLHHTTLEEGAIEASLFTRQPGDDGRGLGYVTLRLHDNEGRIVTRETGVTRPDTYTLLNRLNDTGLAQAVDRELGNPTNAERPR